MCERKVDKERRKKLARALQGAHPRREKRRKLHKLTDNFERLSVEHNAQTVLDIRGGGGARANLFYVRA
jgi:hypothetical protein